MTPRLELRGVCHEYRSGSVVTVALVGIDLEVEPGTLLAIVGPSGSGKSTLLKLAGGLERACGGEVLVNGISLGACDETTLSSLRRRDVGYVFQEYNLVPSLTAVENVALPLELDGVGRREARRDAMSALERVSSTHSCDRFPDELSGGEQQRVAIARAIVGHRSLLLADEPTGALDTLSGEMVMRMLRDQCTAGRAVVFVTHNMSHAAWADRVLYLRDGKLVDSTSYLGPDSLLCAETATA